MEIVKKSYCAYIESFEDMEDSYELILDGIEASRFEQINEENYREEIIGIEENIFVLKLSKVTCEHLRINSGSSWISFTTNDNTVESYPAELYNSVMFDDNVERINISNIDNIELSDSKAKVFSMNVFKQSNLVEIEDLIEEKLPNYIENVFVYNVGQGNCNAITNYRCIPQIFYDFGGGAYQNTRTYPKNLEFDFRKEPLVILSHWDWDHMVSILKSEHANIKKSNWIVPKQQIGITHLKVAVELYNSGKLKIWPDDEIDELYILRKLHIQKLNGSDKNNSGLVLTVFLGKNSEQAVLLPGDANYNLIDKHFYSYYGLVATHHGASSHDCLLNMPKPFRDFNKIAFSFGENNSYNHPKRASLYEHASNGWSNTFYTLNGHIHFGFYSYPPHHRHFISSMGDIQ